MVLLPMLVLALAAAQSPPQVSTPAQQPPQLFPSNDQKTVEGVVVAYDWATRYYMEGARVENFIFQSAADTASGESGPTFVRVVLVWHPADRPRILPSNFYSSSKKWRLTLRTATPFDFVRKFCETGAAPTFISDIGEGRKIELPRYVSPAILPPSAGITKNFNTALAKRLTSPQMPDPRSISCMYLEKVSSVRR